MYWKLAVVFAFFIIFDILGYKLLKRKRRVEGWIILPLLAVAAIFCLVMQFRGGGTESVNEKSLIYQSYRYIQDGNTEMALESIEGVSDKNGLILRAFAYASSGDYLNGYFKAKQILADNGISKNQSEVAESLRNICGREAGLINDKSTEEFTDFDSYLASLEREGQKEDFNAQYEVKKLLDEYMDKLIASAERKSYEEEYQVGRTLNLVNVEGVSEKEIDDIISTYGENEDVLKLECKYYASVNKYDIAREKGMKLVEKNGSPENKVILADIIANEAFGREETVINKYREEMFEKALYDDNSGGGNDPFGGFGNDVKKEYVYGELDETDEEISASLKKAKEKYSEAAKLQKRYGYEEAKNDIDKLLAEGDSFVKEANYIEVQRAKNYIRAQFPDGKDTTGYYDLELAKLNIASGEKTEAGVYLYNVINNSNDLSENSELRDEIGKVVTEYNKMSSDLSTPGFESAVVALVNKHGQNIIPNTTGTVNGLFNNYVGNTLKYSKIFVHVSRIDTSAYPTITAYVNINGKKDDNSKDELASDFTKEDFTLIDTQYEIKDFELLTSNKDTGVNISIVMDKSGSMQGQAISDAKTAAKDVVAHMGTAQKISIVAYDYNAANVCPLTTSQDSLNNAIDSIYADGGTDIGAGLLCALDEIEKVGGTNSIILMSDGQNGGSDSLVEEAIARANSAGISIYSVAFGSADEDYMRHIAEATGGQYFKANDSSSLSDIYLMLQKYIINNYCFKYTVTKNVDTDPRYLEVYVSAYNTNDHKDYWIKEESKPGTGSEGGITKVDEDSLDIASITPGNISVQDVQSGITLGFGGSGFKDITEIEIGNTKLSEISITDVNNMTAKLKGDLSEGIYGVKVRTADGRLVNSSINLYVFKGGTTKSVQLGNTVIDADIIGRTGDKTLIASGNVMINKFIHCSGDMIIYADSLEPDIDLTKDVYLGDSGHIEGKGKLYINYDEIVNANGNNNGLEKLAVESVFARAFIFGDYIVRKNGFYANINKTTTDLDSTIGDYDAGIPLMMDVDMAEVKLYSNRLVLEVKEANPIHIVENIKDSLTNKDNKSKGKKDDQKDTNGNNTKTWGNGILQKSSASFSIAATPNGFNFGGSLKINGEKAVSLGAFEVKAIEIKINSLDEDHEYWKFGGTLEFSKLKAQGMDSISGSISSFYALPDKVDLSIGLDGIVFAKVCELTEVSGGVQGLSTIALKIIGAALKKDALKMLVDATGQDPNTAEFQEVILHAGAEVEINLLALAPENALTKQLKKWGKLGEGSGKTNINLTNIGVDGEVKMDFFKAANVEVKYGISVKKGFSLSGTAAIDLSILGASISGETEAKLENDWSKTDLSLVTKGKLKVPIVFINYEGEVGAYFELANSFDSAFIKFEYKDGSKDKYIKLWYDDKAGVTMFNKVGVEIR